MTDPTIPTKDQLLAQLAELDATEAEHERFTADVASGAWAERRAAVTGPLDEIARRERVTAAVIRLIAEADTAEAEAMALDAGADAEAAAREAAATDVRRITARLDDLRARASAAADEAEAATAEGRDDDALAARQLAGALVIQAEAVAPALAAAERAEAAYREREDSLRDQSSNVRDSSRQLGWAALVDPLAENPHGVEMPLINGLRGPVECWASGIEDYHAARRLEHPFYRPAYEPDPAAIQGFADRHGRLRGHADAQSAWEALYPHEVQPPQRRGVRGVRRLIPGRSV